METAYFSPAKPARPQQAGRGHRPVRVALVIPRSRRTTTVCFETTTHLHWQGEIQPERLQGAPDDDSATRLNPGCCLCPITILLVLISWLTDVPK